MAVIRAGDAPTSRGLTEGTIREPLRRVLVSRQRREIPAGKTTAAAVLVPLFERDGELRVWFVRRPASMRRHAGQVAFPGGKSDARDESLLVTALREAEEELGIPSSSVDVIGPLDDTPTGTGFTITPWVGWLPPSAEVRPNPAEVARALAPALRTFLAPRSGVRPWHGWTVDGELVWGATAAIVDDLVRVLLELQ